MKQSRRSKLKKLLTSDDILYGPAVYDCIGAKAAEEVGFPLIFTSGFGIAASLYGLPDLGYLTVNDMLCRAGAIARAVDIPVIADMDTGYGGPLNLIRLVEEAVRHDIGGIIIEDQKWPKRCGHLRGKQLVETDEYLEKLKAADEARSGEDFTIVARTDALSVYGLDEALRRGE
ncbi:MAG: carboxyvinyl-carboxyphosphonate phosphorylmutase, partial [Nitrospirae bacterium]